MGVGGRADLLGRCSQVIEGGLRLARLSLAMLGLELGHLLAQAPAVDRPAGAERSGRAGEQDQGTNRERAHPCSIILARRVDLSPTCRAQAESSMPRAAAL